MFRCEKKHKVHTDVGKQEAFQNSYRLLRGKDMYCDELLKQTVVKMDKQSFSQLVDCLVDKEILVLHVLNKEDLSPPVLAELIYEALRKIGEARWQSFEWVLRKYTDTLDSLVKSRITIVPKNGSNEIPPARKYYDAAQAIVKEADSSVDAILEYTKIMICLYTSIIDNEYRMISDVSSSIADASIDKILNALKNGPDRKKVGNIDRYNSSRSTVMLMIVLFFYIKYSEQ